MPDDLTQEHEQEPEDEWETYQIESERDWATAQAIEDPCETEDVENEKKR